MNYDEMPSGPKMNFLVATKVMEQEIPEECYEQLGEDPGWQKVSEYRWEKRDTHEHWPYPYSANMLLLTELLGKLVSDGYEIHIAVYADGSGAECFIWRGENPYLRSKFRVASSIKGLDEIPLALCRASLKLRDLECIWEEKDLEWPIDCLR